MAHTLWHKLWEHKNNPFLATGKHQVFDPLNPPYRPGVAEEPPMFNPSGVPGRASLRQVAGDIAGASQAHDPNTRVGGWPGQGRGETQEAQMARIRRGREGAHDYPMALSQGDFGMYGQAQKDIAAGKFAPEEDDEMQKLLRYMFMSELMAGMAGGDPPTPYTVQAGPAARAFPTMPSMM